MEGQFFPALWIWDFNSAQKALGRLGIGGETALLCLTKVVIGRDMPVIFEKLIYDPISRIDIVLIENSDGTIGLWLGALQHLSDTTEEALLRYVDEVIDERLSAADEPPVIAAFPWVQPIEVFHV